jgi:hypothetical protein
VRMGPRDCLATLDAAFLIRAALWGVASLLAFGLVAAIIPNPVFGRQIPPEPFAIAVWIASAPLMGLVIATYVSPVRVPAEPLPSTPGAGAPFPATRPVRILAGEPEGTTLGTLAGLGAFLAIGCPVCNKIALLLLGASGALTVFAPLQPLIGALSLALLAATLAWRLRMRARGGACRLG